MDEAKTNIFICQNASNSQLKWALEKFFGTPPPPPLLTPDLKFGGPVQKLAEATPTPRKIERNFSFGAGPAEEVPGDYDLQDIPVVFLDDLPEPIPGGLTTGFDSTLEKEALLEIEPASQQLEQPETPATAERKRIGVHCAECGKVCRTKYLLLSHQCPTTDEFKCAHCRFKGTCKRSLELHLCDAHKIRGKWNYKKNSYLREILQQPSVGEVPEESNIFILIFF